VSIFGLGYVGAVTAACLADRGFRVIGADVNPVKVRQLNNGISPIVEEGIGDLVKSVVRDGKLVASEDVPRAVLDSQVSLICVGTPSKSNGDLDLQYVIRVSEQIGAALQAKDDYHTIILRSTVLPGTTEGVVLPILEERSGRRAGEGFGLCFNPEFLREGSSIRDFQSPPFTLVGALTPRDAAAVRQLYGWLPGEFIECDIKTAEMLKYVNNGYHALKVAFANEVGRLCAALQVDSHRVMEIFCKDTKQNLSGYYLKPGYAFGGSCLPKDLRALLYKAKREDVPLELMQSVLASNQTQIELGVRMVEATGRKRIGLLGLSFKPGTDDLRESPLVQLAETLLGRGYTLKIFDPHVSLARLIGANRTYIVQELPHINELLCNSMEEVLASSDVLVIGSKDPRYREALRLGADKPIIDLVRIVDDLSDLPPGYRGLGW